MKKLLFLCLLALLPACLGAAQEGASLLEEHQLMIRLVSFQQAQGEAVMDLQCTNLSDQGRVLLLFAPEANGQPASFRYGWGAQDLPLEPGEQRIAITIYADDPQEWLDAVAFRFVEAGQMTSPVQLHFQANAMDAVAADFNWAASETPLIASAAVHAPLAGQPFRFYDTITPEQLEKLDYGQLQICIRSMRDDQECLIPFATVPVHQATDGRMEALYSGHALISNVDPAFPLPMRETYTDTHCLYHAEKISLSGPFIFFSTLQFTLSRPLGQDQAQITACALDGVEEKGQFENLPLSLLDTISMVHIVQRLTPSGETMALETVDVYSLYCPLDQTLAFSLIPAEELGEIYGYFEYFFSDQTDVIHPPFPLEIHAQ